MIDIISSTKSAKASSTTSSYSGLRSSLIATDKNRGTTYTYVQRQTLSLFCECLQELGFDVTACTSSNNECHIIFNDYSDKACMQIFNTAVATTKIAFLYPRHIAAEVSAPTFSDSSGNCNVTLRIIGEGAGKTKTLIMMSTTTAPALNCYNFIYFTEAKYLPTGEKKKAIVIRQYTSLCYYIYDNDWSFLPGFASDLTTFCTLNAYWYQLSVTQGYRNYIDPYTSYKLFQEQNYFAEIPITSTNGLWEFPDIIINPYGQLTENATSEAYQNTFQAGNIYEIGDKKYLFNYTNDNLLYRVE